MYYCNYENINTSCIIVYCKLLEDQIFRCSVESFYIRWFSLVLCAVKCHSILFLRTELVLKFCPFVIHTNAGILCVKNFYVLKALTMVLPSFNFYRDYLWILLKTTIIVNNYFLSLFHFEYLCMSTRSAVQVLFIAYVFVTFEWS